MTNTGDQSTGQEQGRDPEAGPTAHYAPGQERPLTGYAALSSAFAVTMAGAITALRLAGRELPGSFQFGELVVTGVAAHKLSRLIAKDKVSSFVRAPFTRFQSFAGHGEVEEEAYGHGLRRALGELLVCPYCLGVWCASGLTIGMVAAPRQTRLISEILVADTISDFMQLLYLAAEKRS